LTYTSSSEFADGLQFFQLPFWIGVNVKNFGNHSIQVEKLQNGVPAGTALTAAGATSDGLQVVRIDSLPSGEMTLRINVLDSNNTVVDSRSFNITYIPTPFIEITNVPNNHIYTRESDFSSANKDIDSDTGRFKDPAIKGRLVNFNLAGNNGGDLQTLAVTINGTTNTVANDSTTDPRFILVKSNNSFTGEFEFNNFGDDALKLVNGPNTINITASTGGIPVSTTITVYLFPDNVPNVTSVIPVPVGEKNDQNERFKNTGELQYSTTEKTMDVLFSVVNADQVVVSIDGQQYVESKQEGPINSRRFQKVDGKLEYVEGNEVSGGAHNLRIKGLTLPDSGVRSITVMAVAGTTTSSKTLQVTRIRVPYRILSPLEEERVINQNFLKVSIEAEGADQILLGKESMVKGSDGIFRLELSNLKSGNNTIKFTIMTGSEKQEGSFTVTYAAQNEVGAQYKTTFPNSGKLSVFNGALTLSLPKGTMLKQPQDRSQQNAPQINLFGNVPILFGIADKQDGRTVKRYNRVAEGGAPQGEILAEIGMDPYAAGLIQGTRNFGFASQLFWIDAGYYDSKNKTLVGAMHPYATSDGGSDRFFLRSNNPGKWLVPTNRGTITLKYDPNIRNEAARDLSVWHFTNGGWKNLGGVVNTGSKTISASFDGFGYYAVMSMRYGFEDIVGHRYARNHINTVFAKGIMDPRDPYSLFGVYENITRGEFATMIVKILDLPLNYDTTTQQLTFSDVPPVPVANALWDYRYIETAARAGIVSGLAPRQFAPGAFLTREQAAVIIARALNYKLGTVEKDKTSLAKQFVDAGQIDYYAVTSVQAVVKEKIMSGLPNTADPSQKTYLFSPKANLNRADMAVIAYNILAKLKRI
jgi:hypothetical protein